MSSVVKTNIWDSMDVHKFRTSFILKVSSGLRISVGQLTNSSWHVSQSSLSNSTSLCTFCSSRNFCCFVGADACHGEFQMKICWERSRTGSYRHMSRNQRIVIHHPNELGDRPEEMWLNGCWHSKGALGHGALRIQLHVLVSAGFLVCNVMVKPGNSNPVNTYDLLASLNLIGVPSHISQAWAGVIGQEIFSDSLGSIASLEVCWCTI